MNRDSRVIIVDSRLAKKQSRSMKCSSVLNWMVLFGFMVNYMLRVNMSIVIVEMESNNNHHNVTTFSSNSTAITAKSSGMELDWSEFDKNLILGSFYWGYIITELPGGLMAEKVGTRPIFGYSMLLASIVTLFTPMAMDLGLYPLLFCRALLGLALGVTYPAIQPIAVNWIPPNERGKFIANMMATNLGAGFTILACGFIIPILQWKSVFYISGLVGVVWSVFWFCLIFETPAQHPRITESERDYIESQIAEQSSSPIKPKQIPWAKIFTSLPVWAIIITHVTSVFGYFTISLQLPMYMKYVLHYEIKANGLLSSLPYFGKFFMAFFVGIIADRIITYRKMSKTTTRKLFTSIGVFSPGILMIAQVYYGENQLWSVLIFVFALTLNGAVSGGYLGSALDIAPNFSGIIFGIANTLPSFGGFLSTYIVGELTNNNQTFGQWKIVFWILAITYTISGFVFLIYGTAQTLSWNSIPVNEETKDVQLPKIMVY
ncbi:Major facilitator superfamily,Major facilitator superfamily domain [Cinara cedri]|uniref:Major facilitator superfamily,Major facilitator superfamily domain n=1 Tax=Cinara cedri TaxID=506608 RepID=A0A5E4N8H3_9HEMI|nr:Major facilitator superfamily,Major facilitator superfamily domain [Cinara cedri]